MKVRSATYFALAWGLCLAAWAGVHLAVVVPQQRVLAACRTQSEAKA